MHMLLVSSDVDMQRLGTPFWHFLGTTRGQCQDTQHCCSLTRHFRSCEHGTGAARPNELSSWRLAAVPNATTNTRVRIARECFRGRSSNGTSLKTTSSTRRIGLGRFSAWFWLIGWMFLLLMVPSVGQYTHADYRVELLNESNWLPLVRRTVDQGPRRSHPGFVLFEALHTDHRSA